MCCAPMLDKSGSNVLARSGHDQVHRLPIKAYRHSYDKKANQEGFHVLRKAPAGHSCPLLTVIEEENGTMHFALSKIIKELIRNDLPIRYQEVECEKVTMYKNYKNFSIASKEILTLPSKGFLIPSFASPIPQDLGTLS